MLANINDYYIYSSDHVCEAFSKCKHSCQRCQYEPKHCVFLTADILRLGSSFMLLVTPAKMSAVKVSLTLYLIVKRYIYICFQLLDKTTDSVCMLIWNLPSVFHSAGCSAILTFNASTQKFTVD